MLDDCQPNQQGTKLEEKRSENSNISIDSSTEFIESSQTSTSFGYNNNYPPLTTNSTSDPSFSSSSSSSTTEQVYSSEPLLGNRRKLSNSNNGETRTIQDLSVNHFSETAFLPANTCLPSFQVHIQQQQQQPVELRSSLQIIRPANSENRSKIGHDDMNVADLQGTVDASENISASIPVSAHSSEHHSVKYISDQSTKTLPSATNSSMALNFSSHDLLLQSNHQVAHPSLSHHNGDNNMDVKHHLSNPLEIDSGSLMQSAAANMNMWKNSMSLGHSFLPGTDMGSFTAGWPSHGGNHLGHQATPQSMTHHILESSQHLISYPQHHHNTQHHHQRSMSHLSNQDLVGVTLKSQAEQATFMLNSINQNSTSSGHSQMSHHQTPTITTPANDNLNLRTTQSVDHGATSYNLALNDNHQFYNSNSRNESNRSHVNSVKAPIFPNDRSVPMSLSNHHQHHQHQHHQHHQASQIASYHSAVNDQVTHPLATSSHHIVSGPGTSNGHLSRNIGNFRCPHCGDTFNMRNLYQSHLKTHSHEKGPKAKFHCEQCGHSFSQKTSLNRHMKSHTGERPFPCEVCGKAFSEKERLKIHMRTHTGEKPFSCGICGKSFSQKSTVKRHQTVHTGEKKFKCDCGKGFANRGNLIAHIKTRGANHFE